MKNTVFGLCRAIRLSLIGRVGAPNGGQRRTSTVKKYRRALGLAASLVVCAVVVIARAQSGGGIGQELSVPVHLTDGQELTMTVPQLIAFGQTLFNAMWTSQEGQGRPLSKGTGNPLSDSTRPLVFPRNFNRISAPETNSCSGCHNKPRAGGGGDIVSNVFVLGQRFDFITFDHNDMVTTAGALDESGKFATFQQITNSRKTVGMFGSGYLENVAIEITKDLQAIRDSLTPGTSAALVSKGISYGSLAMNADGTWNMSQCQGIPAPSLSTKTADGKPTLIIRPYHQAGNVISVRQFTNNAFNHHHGIQSEERFGIGVDADGDGFTNELTRADVTAATLFQVTLPVPGRVINTDPTIQAAIVTGESRFSSVGCASCHIPALPLKNSVFTEPNPFNPAGNLQQSSGVLISFDLNDRINLPAPRLKPTKSGTMVPAYTDLKLHNITTGLPSCAANPGLSYPTQCDADVEPLDQNQAAGSAGFFAGNGMFITRKLWGIANQHSFGHHGQYTTMREAVLAHNGEALTAKMNFQALSADEQNDVIEFLKSLQILPAGKGCLVVDQNFKCIATPAGIQP